MFFLGLIDSLDSAFYINDATIVDSLWYVCIIRMSQSWCGITLFICLRPWGKQPIVARMEKGATNLQIDAILKALASLEKTLAVMPLKIN